MKEIQTNGITILLVEATENQINDILVHSPLIVKDVLRIGMTGIKLPSGQYQILGKSTELSEEQMKEIVPSFSFDEVTFIYPDYLHKNADLISDKCLNAYEFDTVKESYLSLLEANGIVDRCSIEEPEIYQDDGIRQPCKYDYPHGFDLEQYHKDLKQWQEAQSKVKHYLVLKRI